MLPKWAPSINAAISEIQNQRNNFTPAELTRIDAIINYTDYVKEMKIDDVCLIHKMLNNVNNQSVLLSKLKQYWVPENPLIDSNNVLKTPIYRIANGDWQLEYAFSLKRKDSIMFPFPQQTQNGYFSFQIEPQLKRPFCKNDPSGGERITFVGISCTTDLPNGFMNLQAIGGGNKDEFLGPITDPVPNQDFRVITYYELPVDTLIPDTLFIDNDKVPHNDHVTIAVRNICNAKYYTDEFRQYGGRADTFPFINIEPVMSLPWKKLEFRFKAAAEIWPQWLDNIDDGEVVRMLMNTQQFAEPSLMFKAWDIWRDASSPDCDSSEYIRIIHEICLLLNIDLTLISDNTISSLNTMLKNLERNTVYYDRQHGM